MYFKHPIVRPAELSKVTGLSLVTLWSYRKRGLLPEPLKLGPRFLYWNRDVLNAWIDDQQGEK